MILKIKVVLGIKYELLVIVIPLLEQEIFGTLILMRLCLLDAHDARNRTVTIRNRNNTNDRRAIHTNLTINGISYRRRRRNITKPNNGGVGITSCRNRNRTIAGSNQTSSSRTSVK